MHNEPDYAVESRSLDCGQCGDPIVTGYVRHNGQIICEACLHELADVQQGLESDRLADVAADDEQPF